MTLEDIKEIHEKTIKSKCENTEIISDDLLLDTVKPIESNVDDLLKKKQKAALEYFLCEDLTEDNVPLTSAGTLLDLYRILVLKNKELGETIEYINEETKEVETEIAEYDYFDFQKYDLSIFPKFIG